MQDFLFAFRVIIIIVIIIIIIIDIMVWCLPMVWETRVHSQVESYQRLQKWYLTPPFLTLSIIRYRSKGSRAIQGKE